MSGYANRTVRLDFPDLGDEVFLLIRNPKSATAEQLSSDGTSDGREATYQIVSRLIVDWHVYDATSTEEDQPELELPATPEKTSKLPFSMLQDVMRMVGDSVTPR